MNPDATPDPATFTINRFGAIIDREIVISLAIFQVNRKGYIEILPGEPKRRHLFRKGKPLGVLAWEHRARLQDAWNATGTLDRSREGICIVSDEDGMLLRVSEQPEN